MIKNNPHNQEHSATGCGSGCGEADISDLASRLSAGDPMALAHCLSLVEKGSRLPALFSSLASAVGGKSRVFGITGPPGVGKSTLTGRLISEFRSLNLSVGVIAVDPSSPFQGGAVLGDRIRMREHDGDDGVFIRSLASRGVLGGLAPTINAYIRLMKTAGREIVIVETVGVGQSEIDVCEVAETTALISAPGMGDELQTLKGGILEVADIVVLNKSDLPGASSAYKQLCSIGNRAHELPALMTEATTGRGIAALAEVFLNHAGRTRLQPESHPGGVGSVEAELALLLFDRIERLTPSKTTQLLDQLHKEELSLNAILKQLFSH